MRKKYKEGEITLIVLIAGLCSLLIKIDLLDNTFFELVIFGVLLWMIGKLGVEASKNYNKSYSSKRGKRGA